MSSGCDETAPSAPEMPDETPPRPHRITATGTRRPDGGDPGHRGLSEPSLAVAPKLEAEMANLRKEAGVDAPSDPMPGAGDLRTEIDSFTTLEACVQARALRDPLIADAIGALGYDTLVHDACRLLQALKTRTTAPCRPIIASALRSQCETAVAAVTTRPELCPLVHVTGRIDTRDPFCLARATGDERTCAAVLTAAQATCRALVRGDPAECDNSTSCRRQVERWRRLIDKPAPRDAGTTRGLVVLEAIEGTPVLSSPSLEMDEVARAGAAVKKGAGARLEIVLGTPPGPLWASWDSQGAQPRLFLDVSLNPLELAKGPVAVAAPRVTLDLVAPKVGRFSALTATHIEVTGGAVSTEVGAPLKLEMAADLHDGTRAYHATVAIETYVRDVIAR